MSLGVTFKKAPLATLDALAIREPREFYRIVKNLPNVKGSLLLQTCNRVEMYFDATSLEDVAPRILSDWALETRFKQRELSSIVEVRREIETVNHIVR